MKKIKVLIILWLIATLVILSVKIVPELEDRRGKIALIFFIIGYFLLIIYIIKMWKKGSTSNKKINKPFFILKAISFLIIIPIFLTYLGIIIAWNKPFFSHKKNVGDYTFFIYEIDCFPDSNCHFDNYYSDVYVKNKYLPIIHHLTEINYHIDHLYIENNELILEASKDCNNAKDGKINRVKL